MPDTPSIPVNTADLYDERGEELDSLSLQFQSLGGRTHFSGPVRTVRCLEDNALVKATLATPGNGAVLVVDGGGSLRTALMGDLIAASAVDNGWAGVVINGAIRDRVAVAGLPLGVKALGSNPRKSAKAAREDLAAREIWIKKITEETLDTVLGEVRQLWAEKAGLKTYADAVAQAIEARAGQKIKSPMSVERWKAFAAGVSHDEARKQARAMGIDIFWSWELPRTPDGFYPITGGRAMAVVRGLATAPFADLVWRETAKPDLADDKAWADAIHAVFPEKMLAYNLSPSWNWDAWGFTDD